MPNKLTRDELEKRIEKLDSRFNLSKKYDFKDYKNNRSIIMIEHDCGKNINTSWKLFQEGKIRCSCETKNLRRISYDTRNKMGRGKYLLKENYLESVFNDPDYELLDNPVYTGNNKMKIRVKHKICENYFYTTPNRFQQGRRCPECANLKRVGALPGSGASKISRYLQDNELYLSNEYKFDDCKDKRKMPFDYIDTLNQLIEFDGEQHFNPYKRGYKTAVIHDKLKNEYCRENSITLLRIPYNEESNIEIILDTFYKGDYNTLKRFNILLITPDLEIKPRKYYTENSVVVKQCELVNQRGV